MNVPYGPILVVEDVPNIRDLLQVTLSFKGYPVMTAADGREALEKVSKERPALIISDLMMPNLDGFGMTQQLRTNPLTHDIPIILISATYLAPEDKDFAHRLGAIRFLEKPVDTEEFLLTVAEILTQGPPNLPEPLSDEEFYSEYRQRLETKMRHKNKQITRTQTLLVTLPDDQKPAFRSILEEETSQLKEIRQELDRLYEILDIDSSGLDTTVADESE